MGQEKVPTESPGGANCPGGGVRWGAGGGRTLVRWL